MAGDYHFSCCDHRRIGAGGWSRVHVLSDGRQRARHHLAELLRQPWSNNTDVPRLHSGQRRTATARQVHESSGGTGRHIDLFVGALPGLPINAMPSFAWRIMPILVKREHLSVRGLRRFRSRNDKRERHHCKRVIQLITCSQSARTTASWEFALPRQISARCLGGSRETMTQQFAAIVLFVNRKRWWAVLGLNQ